MISPGGSSAGQPVCQSPEVSLYIFGGCTDYFVDLFLSSIRK